MAKVIIGIHGLGNKPAKRVLQNWWRLAMREGLIGINKRIRVPRFELVYWSDLLYDKPLSRRVKDKNDPYYLHEIYTSGPKNFEVEDHSTLQKAVDFIGNQINKIFLNDDFSLNYTFITDAILHKYFRELDIYYAEGCEETKLGNCEIKRIIRERLACVLRKHKNDDIFLIGHSMGSIIAYDVLNFLVPNIKVHTLATMGSPLGLPVVVNKIALEQKKKQKNNITIQTPPGVVSKWVNFSDIEDKVAFNYKLADDFEPNNLGIKATDFLVTNTYMIGDEKNPHKSFGYLRTPEFANVLFDFISKQKPKFHKQVSYRFKTIFSQINKPPRIKSIFKMNGSFKNK